MSRRRPEFESGKADAEAAKLKKFSDAGGSQSLRLSDAGRIDFRIASGIFKSLFFLSAAVGYCASPPHLISFSAGAFDFLREKHRTFEGAVECKFHLKGLKAPNRYLEFRPLVGLMATAKGSVYVYAGLNFDLLFCDHLLFAPGFAAGYYSKGGGKDLGYPLEFRSGIELAWQFGDWHRLGIHFYHLSNASLGHRNPGEESLVLFYDIPLVKGFPFIRDCSK